MDFQMSDGTSAMSVFRDNCRAEGAMVPDEELSFLYEPAEVVEVARQIDQNANDRGKLASDLFARERIKLVCNAEVN